MVAVTSAVTVGVEVGKGVSVKQGVDGRVEVALDAAVEIDCCAGDQRGESQSYQQVHESGSKSGVAQPAFLTTVFVVRCLGNATKNERERQPFDKLETTNQSHLLLVAL